MKRMTFRWILGALFLALVASPAQRAAADDETDQVEIKVRAPLDATNCVSTPPTVSLLGLTIDVGTASFDANSDCENCEDDEKSEDGPAPVTVTCADLTVGQVVEVKLASDALDPVTGLLVATEVDVGSGDGDGEDASIDVAKIEAPLQSVDPNVPSVTVLGLVVDVSHATLEGADDEGTDGGRQPVDASQLIVGQIVELKLVSNQAPLAASALEVNNFGNQIDVELDDQNGNEVDDGSVEDVQIEVDETVVVQAAAGTMQASKHVKTKHVKKKVLLHTTSSGSFTLTGLPTGKAKITVTRGTTSGRKRVVVKANATQQVKIRLR